MNGEWIAEAKLLVGPLPATLVGGFSSSLERDTSLSDTMERRRNRDRFSCAFPSWASLAPGGFAIREFSTSLFPAGTERR